ncbi:MAG: hypothetical protein JWR19_2053 [Pedosphaera sp.]|nr:hypothetical protein [Pedosphaera sp.]
MLAFSNHVRQQRILASASTGQNTNVGRQTNLPNGPHKTDKIFWFQWISIALLMLVGIICIPDRSTLSTPNKNISHNLNLTPI